MADKELVFAVVGADHGHIHGLSEGMIAAGAVMKGWWTKEEPVAPFEGVPRVQDRHELLEDPEVDVILIGAMPSDRAPFSLEALDRGKDVLCDKPAALTLEELDILRRVTTETGRIWQVNFNERYMVRAAIKADRLVQDGVIGRVVQMVGLGPHRIGPAESRPWWFFESRVNGGIIGTIGCHQIDQFLFYTSSTSAEIVAATVGNFAYPEFPRLEDFGEVILRGDGGTGYIEVDYYTPIEQKHPGDIRTIIRGTKGQIEIRKYVDLAGRPGGDHLILMVGDRVEYIDCSKEPIVFFEKFIDDVRNRTEAAASQEHPLVVTELAIRAQELARESAIGNLESKAS
jgi:predicted dehydrogenase